MKRSLFIFVTLFFCLQLWSNLVQNQPTEYIQPDGTKLTLLVSGDEYYHRVHDEAGYTILKNPQTGYAVYAIPDGKSIKPSDYIVGQVNPATLGIEPNLMDSSPSIENRFNEAQRLRNAGERAVPTGNLKNVVCFVRFSDQAEFPTSNSWAYYDNLYNSMDQASLKDYYDEMSAGQLNFISYLRPSSAGNVISLQSSHPRGYFSPFDLFNNPAGYIDDASKALREWQLVNELLPSLNNLLDDSINLDGDNDGNLDGLTLIIRGGSDLWGNLLWPHFYPSSISAGSLNGKNVWNWIFQFETALDTDVICHESGHLIGAPDLYHYTSDEPWHSLNPAWRWDNMGVSQGEFWLTFTKWKYGTWFSNIPTITPTSTPTNYTLTATDVNQYSCYKIQSTLANQYYMLEYRRRNGRYDFYAPHTGLIVYRIITSASGNSNGPPDEVYVYRPGGTLTTEGNCDDADFSINCGRTELHNNTNPTPWLYVDRTNTFPGNLVLTDVQDCGGETITFTIRNSIPNIWTGAVSISWNDASNWTQGIPTSTQYVEIFSGVPRYPATGTGGTCGELKVASGASLTIGSGALTVNGKVNIAGQLIMNNSGAILNAMGDMVFAGSASFSPTAYSHLNCYKGLEFQSGSNINLSNGRIEFMGTENSYLRVYASATLYDLYNSKTAGMLNTHWESNHELTISNEFRNFSGSTFVNSSYQTMHIRYKLTNDAGCIFHAPVGAITFDSNVNGYLDDHNTGDYYNNINVSKTNLTRLYINHEITLLGSLILNSGYLNQLGNLTVGGDWTNPTLSTQGFQGYVPGTYSVTFNGAVAQTISGTNTFAAIILNKNSGELVFSSTAIVTCTSYDWVAGAYRVEGGSFTALDLADVGIFGTITLNSGTITYTQDVSSWIDLRANLTVHGGTFTIYGGSGPAYLSYIDVATLNMDGGVLDFKDVGIYAPASPVFNDNISGGTIRTRGNFDVLRTDFNPTGGTVELYGPGSYNLDHGVGSSLFNVIINKAASRNEPRLNKPRVNLPQSSGHITETNDYRIDEITATSNLVIHGSLTITAGNFNVNNRVIETTYDILVYGKLSMTGAGTIYCDRNFKWYSGSTSNITAGNIHCWQDWYFYNGAAAQLSGSTTQLRADYSGIILASSSNSWFGNLVFSGGGGEEGCYYSMSASCTDSLRVTGYLTINAENELNLSGKRARVTGATTINSNGGLIVGTSGYLYLRGALSLSGYLYTSGGNVYLQGIFTNASTSSLYITGGSFVNNVPLYRDGRLNEDTRAIVNLYGGVHLSSGTFEITNNSLTVRAHADRVWSGGTIKVGGNVVANETSALHMDGGELQMIGNTNSTVDVSAGNYAGSFNVNKTSSSNTVTLLNPIIINGALCLTKGIFNTSDYNLTVYWYVTGNVADAVFNGGTSTLTFTGNATASGFLVSLTVYRLVVNNSSTNNNAFSVSSNVNVTQDLIIQDGTVNQWAGTTVTVGRDLIIASGAGYNAMGNPCSLTIGRNLTDSNTTISSSTGFNYVISTLTFTGANATTISVAATAFDVYNLTISKTAGIAVNVSKPVKVHGACNLTSGIWNDTDVNLTHEFYSDFTIGASASWPTTNLNTISFKGSAYNQFMTNNSSSYIYNLTVDKTYGIVKLGSNLIGLNAGTVTINTGTLDLNHYYYRTTGNININNTGKLSVNDDAWLEVADAKQVNVNSGGILHVVGTAGHTAKITHQSGLYYCYINSGGTIDAEYAIFEYMNTGGVFVKPGSIVSTYYSFHHCTFRNGLEGAALLVINNDQTITINDPVFPTNTWGGTYNVRKTVDNGTVNIYNATGGFAGVTYEGDAYNRINWLGAMADIVITGYGVNTWTPYIGGTVYFNISVTNNGSAAITTPFRVGLYQNAASLPAQGTTPDLYRNVSSLAANASVSLDFAYVTSSTPAVWTTWFRADYQGTVTESDENNNGYGPFTLTWNALPAVPTITITRVTGTNNVRLDWTYPGSVRRFKVYRSATYNGTYSVVGTPTVLNYTEAASATKYFYKVAAENYP